MPIGPLALLGSGETARAGSDLLRALSGDLPCPARAAVLETPAGFETNSAQVADRVAAFIHTRLQDRLADISVIPARRRGTPLSPDDPVILGPLARADLIFMGPGSPTYAIRQLKGSLAWELIRARHRQGAALVFASSAAIAIGAWGLPVYEIFKVGEDVHVVPGLDLLGDLGSHVSFVPHWNNAEGREGSDTRRCFVGLERFAEWRAAQPAGHLTIGIDEHTWLCIDVERERCEVGGVGSIVLCEGDGVRTFPSRTRFHASTLGALRRPDPVDAGIREEAWRMTMDASTAMGATPPPEVAALAERRRIARTQCDWAQADNLRDQLAALGWIVRDTEAGQQLVQSGS